MIAVVFGGGNALGAYHAGAVERMVAEGVTPGWVAGSSIGAITAGLMAGNPAERRLEAVRAFWGRAEAPEGGTWLPEAWRRPVQFASGLQARLLGRPGLFHTRLPDLFGTGEPGLYDTGPLRAALTELIDVGRLNSGEMRVSMTAVDVETCEQVVFDTARERIGIDHLMASAALIPDFPPVEVDGRLLADGGFAANVPLDLVLGEVSAGELVCFALDPFPTRAARPRAFMALMQRQTDLIFASQTLRTLRGLKEVWRLRGGAASARVWRLEYAAAEEETAMKGFDFSRASLDRRRAAGDADMGAALASWRSEASPGPGLHVRTVP